jgi:hypothetical protein
MSVGGGIELLQGPNELTRAMAILNAGVNLAGERGNPGGRLNVPWRLYS